MTLEQSVYYLRQKVKCFKKFFTLFMLYRKWERRAPDLVVGGCMASGWSPCLGGVFVVD